MQAVKDEMMQGTYRPTKPDFRMILKLIDERKGF
jgi:hypothetical protein